MTEEKFADLWDQAMPGHWYQPRPPRYLDDELSGETDSISISEDGGVFWVNDPFDAGQDDYATLEEAKREGQKMIDRLWAEVPSRFAREAGLDANIWTYSFKDETQQFSAENGALRIVREQKDQWTAYRDGNEEGEFPTVAEAAAALAPAGPRP